MKTSSTTTRVAFAGAAAAVLALGVAACSSGGGSTTSSASSSPTRSEPVPVRVRGGRSWRQRLPYLAAAACLALAAAVGGFAVEAQHQADVQRSRAARDRQQADELLLLVAF